MIGYGGRQMDELASEYSLLEAPRWRDGGLYVSDFFSHRVLFFQGDRPPRLVCEVPGQPSGLGWTPAGDLLVVSMLDRHVLRFDGSELHQFADLSEIAPWHCNDMVVDTSGRCYVGNFGWDEGTNDWIEPTCIVRLDANGAANVAATELVFPNGMVITPDGQSLMVAETFAARITAFDIGRDGELRNRRVWADLGDDGFRTTTEALASGACLPDGIALDRDGAMWVADAGGQGALRVAEGGRLLDRIPVEGQTAFAVALGGGDGRSLFMCTAMPYGKGDPTTNWVSRLVRASVEVPGVGA